MPATNIVTASAPSTPLTIVTSQTAIFWMRADLGVTEVDGAGTGVSTWANQQAPGTRDFVQVAAPTARPLVASDGPGGTAMITFDGASDIMTNTWNPPAPGTTPTFMFAVIQAITQTNGDCIWGGQSATVLVLVQLATNGQCRLTNGTSGPTNGNLTLSTARRVKALYGNAITDYLTVGVTNATGTALGNTDATSFAIGARVTANFANVGYCEIGAWPAEPTAGELTALDAYVSARYGAGVLA